MMMPDQMMMELDHNQMGNGGADGFIPPFPEYGMMPADLMGFGEIGL